MEKLQTQTQGYIIDQEDNAVVSNPTQNCDSSVEREQTLDSQEVAVKDELDQLSIRDPKNRRIIKAHHKLTRSNNFQIRNEDELNEAKI